MRTIVKEREEKNKGKVLEKGSIKNDFLDYVLANKDEFPDLEDVVDQIVDLFGAATLTTVGTALTSLVNLIYSKEHMKKIRDE